MTYRHDDKEESYAALCALLRLNESTSTKARMAFDNMWDVMRTMETDEWRRMFDKMTRMLLDERRQIELDIMRHREFADGDREVDAAQKRHDEVSTFINATTALAGAAKCWGINGVVTIMHDVLDLDPEANDDD